MDTVRTSEEITTERKLGNRDWRVCEVAMTDKISRFFMAGFLFVISLTSVVLVHGEDKWYSYTLDINQDGLASVTAELQLPTPLATSYDVLSDYAHWPALFARNPTINTVQRTGNRVTVDMTIPSLIFQLDLQLVTETQESPPLRLETTFIRGDFEQYAWEWNLTTSDDHQHTRAALELYMKPSLWVPQWLFRRMLEQELSEHFQKLRHEVLARQRAKHLPPIISAARNLR